MNSKRGSILAASFALASLSALACSSSKEYAVLDPGAAGAAGAPPTSSGDAGAEGKGGSSEPSGGAGGEEDGSGNEAGAAGHRNGEAGAPALGPCGDDSDGEPCGERTCDEAFGDCVWDDACTLVGERSRSCTDWICKAGECQPRDVSETERCERATEGNSCADRTCSEWGGCSYGSTCANSGSRARSCHDHVCNEGTCQAVAIEETDFDGCVRNTDGTSCDTTDCSSCSYSNSCDESSQRWCTEYLCSGGSCSENGFSSTYACDTRDVCSANSEQECYVVEADFCGPGLPGYCPGTQTCSDSCSWGSCVRGLGGCFC